MVYKLYQKDRKILDIPSTKARAPLREIAKKVGLSIDSVHKRMKKMQAEVVFFPAVISSQLFQLWGSGILSLL